MVMENLTFAELAKERYSVRKYKSQPVEQSKLEKMLDTMRIAPTAGNRQPHRIRVITDAAELKMVDECTRCRFEAPLVFLVCYDKNAAWVRDKFDNAMSGDVDASIVTTFLMMQAQELGLGSCWVMFFDPAKTRELFALPENIVPVAFLPVGYPADDAEPAPRHFERQALKDILF